MADIFCLLNKSIYTLEIHHCSFFSLRCLHFINQWYLFFFFSFSRSALRMIAQLWKRLSLSCPSSRRPVTASAGDSETRWLSSPRKRTSPLSLHLEKGLQRSIHCPLALCWTSPIPLRPARLWQVKCRATHLLFFIPGSTLHFTKSFSSRGCRGCRSVNSLYILDDKIVKCLKTV